MDKGSYNTYTISDSDNDSVIIEDHQTMQSSYLLSPEEPEYFRQVLKRV